MNAASRPAADSYVQGWLDCAETVAELCEAMANALASERPGLLGRILNPSLAEVYRHAAEIARAVTVVDGETASTPARPSR